MNLSKRRIISLLVYVIFTFTLIPSNYTFADREVDYMDNHEHTGECSHEEQVIETYSSSEVKPKITLEYGGITPANPMVGQEFEVTYHINPEPFQHNISQPKEIVLVLDGSGSMDSCQHGNKQNHNTTQTIQEDCKITRVDDYCSEHNKSGQHNGSKKITCNGTCEHGKTSSHGIPFINWCSGKCVEHNKDTPHQYEIESICSNQRVNDYCTTCKKSGEHQRDVTVTVLCKTRINELKEAAIAFITKMQDVENLKIGIVVYSSLATINPVSVSNNNSSVKPSGSNSSHNIPNYTSLTNPYFLDINDSRLVTMINNIKPLGGTNTGEGLRKARFLLDRGETDANKTIILMSDGLPTFYSGTSTSNYYMDITTSNDPSIAGKGNENDADSVNNSTEYAKKIGDEKIKGNGYNIFSIGYGLSLNGNSKMQEIHTSMGGVVNIDNQEDPNNTFFATSEGAIDSVFNKIADTLINSYSINDVKLNLSLSNSISAFNGGSVNINGHQINIDPIVYERKENNWYRAEAKTITFKVKSKDSGDISLFGKESSLTYTDIEGKLQTINIPDQKINIRPYSATDAEKLGVTFAPTKNGYLIGDEVNVGVTFSHSGLSGINYTDAKFTLDSNTKPSNFLIGSSFNYLLNFGTITETESMNYNFSIQNDININSEIATQYTLRGNYEYKINNTEEKNNLTTDINVKRGQIKVKVTDSINKDITKESEVILKDRFNNEIVGVYSEGYIIFDEVPTGSHEIVLKRVAEGCSISDENKNAIININYEKPIGEYNFKVQGSSVNMDIPNIDATLDSKYTIQVNKDDEIEVTYKITPQDFEFLAKNNGKSEVVILMDTSNGMAGNRFTNMRNGFDSFKNSISNNDNIKIGVVAFNSNAEILKFSDNTTLTNDMEKLRQRLLNVSTTQSEVRDIGKALEKTNEIFENGDPTAEKTIILISSGEVTSSIDLDLIKLKKYNVITIQVDCGYPSNHSNNTLKTIHKTIGGIINNESYIINVDDHNQGNNSNQSNNDHNNNGLTDVIRGIPDKIKELLSSSYVIEDAKLYFDFNDNFYPVGNSLNLVSENNNDKWYLNIPEIIYTPSENKNENGLYTYSSSEFNVSFKIKVKEGKVGQLQFNVGNNIDVINNYISYTKFNNTEKKTKINTPLISVNDKSDKVVMEVSDSSGSIKDIYDSSNEYTNNDHIITNDGENYKLYGQSTVKIDFEGNEVTHLRYRFIKEGQDSSEVEWKYISGNSDVNTEQQGYLTQMPYDVSHMETLSNNSRWSNRQEVFKTAFSNKTGPISLEVSPAHSHSSSCNNNVDHYVTKEEVLNENGQKIVRWIPRSLFVENHNVASYASDYKEASKTWGYIKVPTTGDYWFQTWADDGFYGVITVDGEAKVFGDDFKPRGSSAINAKDKIRLEKDKYYPIYLEYFNWGGSADYRIMYKLDGQDKYQLVDKNWFYPSNSDSPTDNSNNIFMGNSTVNFETEPGVYTIEYQTGKFTVGTRTGDNFEVKNAGKYGVFEIEERFELNKSVSVEKIDKGEEFDIVYTITPKNIKLSDLYKVSESEVDGNNKPSKLTIENIELKDELPSGILTVADKPLSIINSVKDKIEYTLINNEYVASEYKFIVKVKANDSVEFEDESGEIHYRDVSLIENLRISQKQLFTDKPLIGVYDKSIITKHGLLIDNSIRDGEFKAVDSMKYTVGFIIDAIGTNNGFTIEVPKEVSIEDNILIYQLDEEENIIYDSKMSIIVNKKNENDNTSILEISNVNSGIKTGNKYVVIYSINGIKSNATINAKMNTGSEKYLNINILNKLPELF